MVETWQKMLNTVFIRFGTALEKPLKEWTKRSHMKYSVKIDVSKTTAYVDAGSKWRKYERVGRHSRHSVIFEYRGKVKELPAGLLLTTIAKDIGKKIHTTGCSDRQNKQTVQETNTHAMFEKIHLVFRDYYKYTNPTEINERLKKVYKRKKHMRW